ncbi:MAG TPA: molybdenum cofactor guanylyltransferase MobA [Casimicrobiaceae bacterium]|nr:molybdenum cofactor guanylyltransferase MobA [Casimicrobiaceae bacterium]
MRPERADITGIVLAGGQGRRMGSVDKGLVDFAGRPLIAHVLARLAPQVGALVINANRNHGRYASFGVPVIADAVGGFAGPLAGLHAGLAATATPFVVTAPCDSPFVAADLVGRLAAPFAQDQIDIAVARTFDQPHPVFALVSRTVLPHLAAFLAAGGRKIDAWYATLRVSEVQFDDEADAFRNINTVEELAVQETGNRK